MSDLKLESVGKLKTHPDVPDEWLISESVSVLFFDGKELKFAFGGDLEKDENFLFDADQAIQNFLRKNSSDRLRVSEPVYENYRITQDYYDSQPYDVAPLAMNDETDIWKYVRPYEIYVCRGFKEDKNIYLQVHCGCEWEEEHGLQLVFKSGQELTRVGAIDYNPTE